MSPRDPFGYDDAAWSGAALGVLSEWLCIALTVLCLWGISNAF